MDVRNWPTKEGTFVDATNAVSTASFGAAGPGFRWLITGFGASFSGAAVSVPVAATFTGGGSVRMKAGVSTNGDGWHVQFTHPFACVENEDPQVSLGAGGVGAVGHTYILGNLIRATDEIANDI